VTTRDEAEVVRQRYESRVVSTPGVTGVDVREDEPGNAVIVVYAADEADLPDWLTSPSLDGVPLRLQRRRFDPL
jgi:hypothetical protein